MAGNHCHGREHSGVANAAQAQLLFHHRLPLGLKRNCRIHKVILVYSIASDFDPRESDREGLVTGQSRSLCVEALILLGHRWPIVGFARQVIAQGAHNEAGCLQNTCQRVH